MVRIGTKYGTARRHGRFMEALLLAQCGDHAQIYQDRKGPGQIYYILKFYERPDPLGPPVQRTIYLGRLGQWAVERIAKAVAVNAEQRAAKKALVHQLRSHRDRIVMIRQQLHDAMRVARQAAKDCGFYFKGYELRRRRH